MYSNEITLQPEQESTFPINIEQLRHVLLVNRAKKQEVQLVPAQGASDFDNEWGGWNPDNINDGNVETSLTAFTWPRTFPAIYIPEGNTVLRVETTWRQRLYPSSMVVQSRKIVDGNEWKPVGTMTNVSSESVSVAVYKGGYGWYRVVALSPTKLSWNPEMNPEKHPVPSDLIDVKFYGTSAGTSLPIKTVANLGDEVDVYQHPNDITQIHVRNISDRQIDVQLVYD